MDERYKRTIANRIKALRKSHNLTQEELAEKLGLKNKSSIANYESGKMAPCDEVKIKLCNLFNCSVDYLMGLSEAKALSIKNKRLEDRLKSAEITYYHLYKSCQAEIESLKRQIDIKNEYLNTIYAIGFDYDGFEESESLMQLIDSLVDFAKRAVKNDDKYAMYEGYGTNNSTKYYNILHEEVPAPKEDKNEEI